MSDARKRADLCGDPFHRHGGLCVDWANTVRLRTALAAAESSAAQALREREVLEGALEAIAEHTTDEDTHHIARQALASLPSPEPTQPTTECAFPDCDCPSEFPVCEDFPAHLRNPLDPHRTAPEPTQGEQ